MRPFVCIIVCRDEAGNSNMLELPLAHQPSNRCNPPSLFNEHKSARGCGLTTPRPGPRTGGIEPQQTSHDGYYIHAHRLFYHRQSRRCDAEISLPPLLAEFTHCWRNGLMCRQLSHKYLIIKNPICAYSSLHST